MSAQPITDETPSAYWNFEMVSDAPGKIAGKWFRVKAATWARAQGTIKKLLSANCVKTVTNGPLPEGVQYVDLLESGEVLE